MAAAPEGLANAYTEIMNTCTGDVRATLYFHSPALEPCSRELKFYLGPSEADMQLVAYWIAEEGNVMSEHPVSSENMSRDGGVTQKMLCGDAWVELSEADMKTHGGDGNSFYYKTLYTMHGESSTYSMDAGFLPLSLPDCPAVPGKGDGSVSELSQQTGSTSGGHNHRHLTDGAVAIIVICSVIVAMVMTMMFTRGRREILSKGRDSYHPTSLDDVGAEAADGFLPDGYEGGDTSPRTWGGDGGTPEKRSFVSVAGRQTDRVMQGAGQRRTEYREGTTTQL